MSICTLSALLLATPFAGGLLKLTVQLVPWIQQIGQLIQAFRAKVPSPQKTWEFEEALQKLLRQVGREIIAWVYNSLED